MPPYSAPGRELWTGTKPADAETIDVGVTVVVVVTTEVRVSLHRPSERSLQRARVARVAYVGVTVVSEVYVSVTTQGV